MYIQNCTIDSLIDFFEKVEELDKFFPEGSKDKIIKFPINPEILYKCMEYPPGISIDKIFKKKFHSIVLPFIKQRWIKCDNEISSLNNQRQIYCNNLVSKEIEQQFNDFLSVCLEIKNDSCLCNTSVNNVPIYIEDSSNIKENHSFTAVKNIDELIYSLDFLALAPSKEINMEMKEILLRIMIYIKCFRQKIEIPMNFAINEEFWNSELLYSVINTDVFKKVYEEILQTIIDIIEYVHSPNIRTKTRRTKKLNHQFINIDGHKINLEQLDIFQSIIINGKVSNPRLQYYNHNGIFIYRIFDKM